MKRQDGKRGRASMSGNRSLRWAAAVLVGTCMCAVDARADGVAPHAPEQGEPGAIAAGAIAAGAMLSMVSAARTDTAPAPGLGPDAVVGIVLNALRHNDDPVADHGIAVAFAFTSPENHDVTGPIDRFKALVKSSAYRPMIGHARADRGPILVDAEHARERVAITGPHGERAVYMFLLSRQDTGLYKGCWMADGVLRESSAATGQAPRTFVRAVVLRRD